MMTKVNLGSLNEATIKNLQMAARDVHSSLSQNGFMLLSNAGINQSLLCFSKVSCSFLVQRMKKSIFFTAALRKTLAIKVLKKNPWIRRQSGQIIKRPLP